METDCTATRRALRARGISVVYGNKTVLDGVSLDLEPGMEPVGVIGASGAGKTSLVEVLVGWGPASDGVVAFGDLDPYNPPRRLRKTVRAALRGVHEEQNPVEAQQLTGRKVLERAQKLAVKAKRETVFGIDDLCTLVGFEKADLDRVLRKTSFGQQQRLAMASALLTDPDVLILDEPATALDGEATVEVLDAVIGLARERGAAVLVVSHDLELIDRVTSSVIALVDGQEVARGRLPEILADPTDPYLIDLAAIRAAEAATHRPEVPARSAPISRTEILRAQHER